MAKPETDKKKERAVPEAAELNDDELDTVAGGRFNFNVNRESDRDTYHVSLMDAGKK